MESIDTIPTEITDSEQVSELMQWFVMRDLKRSNAKLPAYKMLKERGFEVFTPLKWKISTKLGKRVREEVPFLQDLLFVHAVQENLDSVVDTEVTLQYRYIRGGKYRDPMKVSESEMERFMRAILTSKNPRYYTPGELKPNMMGKHIRIVGGPLDSYEGALLSIRGTKTKRLLVDLDGFLTAAVEVAPEFIQFVE